MKFSLAIVSTLLGLAAAAPTSGDAMKDEPMTHDIFTFDATFSAYATPEQVVNNMSISAPGEPGARGHFQYGIHLKSQTICFNIQLWGVTGDYMSPAKTATHIHEGAFAKNGPPRIAFPNPEGDDKYRQSLGCIRGPFTTGIAPMGTDTGAGFTLDKIVANPSGFFTDSHTKKFLPGVVRGQLGKGKGDGEKDDC